ncbi:MAG: hypothetical protein M3O91_08815 [Chloroflexota bacterium]|nr:hypothetical protein [Chloroflexota bacterium]
MSEERPGDDPERLRELASEAVSSNRAALRARAVPIDVEPPTVFSVEEPRRLAQAPRGHGSAET